MRKYVACLKEHGNNGADRECRALAKGYLQCRMDQCVGAPRASTRCEPILRARAGEGRRQLRQEPRKRANAWHKDETGWKEWARNWQS